MLIIKLYTCICKYFSTYLSNFCSFCNNNNQRSNTWRTNEKQFVGVNNKLHLEKVDWESRGCAP